MKLLIHSQCQMCSRCCFGNETIISFHTLWWMYLLLPNGYTLPKISLATLQPVELRGTSIYWNGHNIANTACTHFKFGTIDIRYMPNWIPTPIGKLLNQLYYVTHYVMSIFSSQFAFGLQIIHPNQFKIHLEPEPLLFDCLYQSSNISNKRRIRLCSHISNQWRVKKLYWFHLFCITTRA